MKTPKRVRGWVGEWLGVRGEVLFPKRPQAPKKGEPFRVARVVELRRGEHIVDVESLVEEFATRWENSDPSGAYDALRAALRKVGKR